VNDLFTNQGGPVSEGPLADRMRPRILDDIIGQDHIVGPGRLLRRAIRRIGFHQ
jgi:putative ATPase